MASQFHLFRPLAGRALGVAREEAVRRGHDQIGTEHLLLGLLAEPESVCGHVLRELGVDRDGLRAEAERASSEGERVGATSVQYTERVRRAIELAVEEVNQSGRADVGTGDLLIGLLREGHGLAGQFLASHGVHLPQVRKLVTKVPPECDESAAGEEERGQRGSRGDGIPGSPAGFAAGARKALTFAQEEAARRRHERVGTEHILLGLPRVEEGIGAKALAEVGVDYRGASVELDRMVRSGDARRGGQTGLTPRAKKTVEAAVHQAALPGHGQPATGHLLLGLLAQSESVGAGLLASLGVDLVTMGKTVEKTIEGQPFAE